MPGGVRETAQLDSRPERDLDERAATNPDAVYAVTEFRVILGLPDEQAGVEALQNVIDVEAAGERFESDPDGGWTLETAATYPYVIGGIGQQTGMTYMEQIDASDPRDALGDGKMSQWVAGATVEVVEGGNGEGTTESARGEFAAVHSDPDTATGGRDSGALRGLRSRRHRRRHRGGVGRQPRRGRGRFRLLQAGPLVQRVAVPSRVSREQTDHGEQREQMRALLAVLFVAESARGGTERSRRLREGRKTPSGVFRDLNRRKTVASLRSALRLPGFKSADALRDSCGYRAALASARAARRDVRRRKRPRRDRAAQAPRGSRDAPGRPSEFEPGRDSLRSSRVIQIPWGRFVADASLVAPLLVRESATEYARGGI